MHSCDNFSYCLRNILSFIKSLLWLNTNARLNCLLVKILSLYLCLWLWSWLHLCVANPVFVFVFFTSIRFSFLKKAYEVFSDLLNLQLKDRIFFSLCADAEYMCGCIWWMESLITVWVQHPCLFFWNSACLFMASPFYDGLHDASFGSFLRGASHSGYFLGHQQWLGAWHIHGHQHVAHIQDAWLVDFFGLWLKSGS